MKPNILFLVVDSLRFDKVDYEQNKNIKNIEFLKKNGVFFEQEITSSPSTVPSSACILTGIYPFNSIISDGNRRKLNSKIETLPDLLKQNGYYVFSFLPKLLLEVGLEEIFQNKDKEIEKGIRLSNGLSEKILNVILDCKDKPWFGYIHLMDIYGDGFMKEEFKNSKYGTNTYDRMISAMDFELGSILKKINMEETIVILTGDHGTDDGLYSIEMEKRKRWVYDYNSDLSYILLKKMIKFFPEFIINNLKKEKILHHFQKKIIKKRQKFKINEVKKIKTSTRQRRMLINSIDPIYQGFDDRLRIPLILSGFGIPKEKIISQQVRSVDILPTICEILKIKNEDKINGISLLPLMEGKKIPEKSIYIESSANWGTVVTQNVIGLRNSSFKYFRDKDNLKNIHLFDLKNDIYEEENIKSKHPDIIKKMEDELQEILSQRFDHNQSNLIGDDESKAIEEELKKLGYL